MLTNDVTSLYTKYIFSPTATWVQTVFFDPLPIKLRPFDVIMAIVLIVSSGKRDAQGPRVRPMRTMQLVAAATTILWFLLGLARGGDARAGSWQIYLILATIVTSFAIAATFRTAEHYFILFKAYVAAAFYHAGLCFIFYFYYVRPALVPWPPWLSIHDDTILWVVVILILITSATEVRGRHSLLYAVVGVPILLFAIQINNRRLAWVSLVGALAVYYALLRPGKTKTKITRLGFAAVPVILGYVVIGWGRTERIFKPLAAFATVSTVEDASTKARNVENLGLIATANQDWLTGTGWGHKYICLSDKYSIAAAMELWQYVPHNGVLGVFAFTGILGFAGIWLRIPTAVFVLARTARLAIRPIDRAVGIIGVVALVCCCNQTYGDMGMFSPVTLYTMAVSFAAAMRIPAQAQVWGTAPRPVGA
jgi:hypothetical protein